MDEKITEKQLECLKKLMNKNSWFYKEISARCEKDTLEELTKEEASVLLSKLFFDVAAYKYGKRPPYAKRTEGRKSADEHGWSKEDHFDAFYY
jgi:hypothetical protein